MEPSSDESETFTINNALDSDYIADEQVLNFISLDQNTEPLNQRTSEENDVMFDLNLTFNELRIEDDK